MPIEVLPESPELEKAVLGALILEPDQLSDVAEIVEISAFHNADNSKIYGMMLSMLAEGVKIDLYTLADRPELKGREMTRYLAGLTSAVDSGVNVLDHARQLANTETRRRLCLFGYELAARAVSDPDGVVDWATSEITAIADRAVRSNDITPLWDVVRATLDDLERRQQARQAGECIGIPTGLQRLDALTGGWRGGQLIVLAGRPRMGKSATMLHFARAAAIAGVPVCVFSAEMPNTQLAGRMLVGGSGVNSGSFRTGDIDADGWRELERAAADLSAMPVYLNDRANITPVAIRSQCKAMARRGGAGWSLSTICNCSTRQAGTRTAPASGRSPPPAVRQNCSQKNLMPRFYYCRSCRERLRKDRTKRRCFRTSGNREPSSRTPIWCCSSTVRRCTVSKPSRRAGTGLFPPRVSGCCI